MAIEDRGGQFDGNTQDHYQGKSQGKPKGESKGKT